MSYDFHISHRVKSTKKPHKCYQCATMIDAGSGALKSTGKSNGDFYAIYEHHECHAAGIAYAKLTGNWGEDFTWFSVDWYHEDDKWLIDNHPICARRLLGDSPEVQKSIEKHLAKAEAAIRSLSA